MKPGSLLCVFIAVGLVLCLSSLAGAAPEAGQFFLGVGYGEAALNNDLYIYSQEAATRQPAMAPAQTCRQDGPAYSVYAGTTLAVNKSRFLGSNAWSFGFQAGYTNLGEYTITVEYADPAGTGYRKLEESAVDLLITSARYWDGGFNLFSKAGVARLQGRYEQEGLLSPRNPAYVPAKESHTYVVYRPEIVFGLGYALSERVDINVQYASILGPKPETVATRFNDSSMVELPNTLYAAGALTLGATFRW